MKKLVDDDLRKDVVDVCLAYYNNNNKPNLKYLTQNNQFVNDETLLYKHPETPYHLEKLKIISNLRNKDEIDMPNKLSSITNYVKLQDSPIIQAIFIKDKVIEFLIENSDSFRSHYKQANKQHEVWLNTFRFDKKTRTMYLSKYGKCVFSEKKEGGFASKINDRAVLIQLVIEGGKDGISAKKIVKYFIDNYKKSINNRRIDAMITTINKKRFEKCFVKAIVKLVNIGKGTKAIKLSVIPLKIGTK